MPTPGRVFARTCAPPHGVPLTVARVELRHGRGTSLEAEARALRYAALAAEAAAGGVTHVLLAHHRDDQAETLLLQLLRGAGPHGLAAMPAASVASGVHWLRPLLGLGRDTIGDQARALGLPWIDDESNADPVHRRNALRLEVAPALSRVFPAWATTLARAAAHQAAAAALQDDLAAIDAGAAGTSGILERAALAVLPEHRAANVLRWFLRRHGLPAPSAARLAAMLAQLRGARPDAEVRLRHGGVELGLVRGSIVVHAPPPTPFDLVWSGEDELRLPHGRLAFSRTPGTGVDARALATASVHVRSRRGGERFQLAPGRPRRALKSILQEAGIPAWERVGLPLVYCGPALVAVARIGVDAACRAPPDGPGISIEWTPDPQ